MEFPQDSDSEIKICRKVYQELSLESTPMGEWKNSELAERGVELWNSRTKVSASYRELGWPFRVVPPCVPLNPVKRPLDMGFFSPPTPGKWHNLVEAFFLWGQFLERDLMWAECSVMRKGISVVHHSIHYRFGFALLIPLWVSQILLTQSLCRLSPGVWNHNWGDALRIELSQ